MNRKKMLECIKNQDFIMHGIITSEEEQKIIQTYDDGYILFPEHLEMMYCLGITQQTILKCVEKAYRFSDIKLIYNWLVAYMGKDNADEFVVTKCKNMPKDALTFASVYVLERHECWNTLSEMEEDDILYNHKQYEKMSLKGLRRHKLYDLYLKKEGHFYDATDEELKFLEASKSWNKLIYDLAYEDIAPREKLLQILYRHDQFEKVLVSNRAEYLTECEEGIEFLKYKKAYLILYQNGCFDDIDWDVFLQQVPALTRTENLFKNNWDILAKYKRHKELWRHGKILWWLRSFF